jgi:hypothetical protein
LDQTAIRTGSWERIHPGVGAWWLCHQRSEKKHKHKHKKKKRCPKVQASCTTGGKKKCCKGLICDEVIDLAGTFWFRLGNADCRDDEDCCFPSACFEGFCKLA